MWNSQPYSSGASSSGFDPGFSFSRIAVKYPPLRSSLTHLCYLHNPGRGSALGLILRLLLIGTVGCSPGFFSPKPPPVRIEPLTLQIRCPAQRPGAELVLLADQEPVALSAQVTYDPFGATPEITPRYPIYLWRATALSSPAEATGEFDSSSGAATTWKVPPAGGLFKIGCTIHAFYSVPPGKRYTGAAREADAGGIMVSGTGEILVQVPTSGSRMVGGVLDGVPLGQYPDPLAEDSKPIVRNHAEVYRIPGWFYRVNQKNRGLRVSPHFTLGDFDMTYDYWQPDYAVRYEYIALHPRLIEKLDLITDRLRATFDPTIRVVLLAGFRSPSYNQDVKQAETDSSQTARYSMHLFGRAADFIIDTDGDGRMDDLNRDGSINIDDARMVRDTVNQIDAESPPGLDSLLGGCGVYPRHDIEARKLQTPYVHVDVRGYLNDLGKPPRWEMP